MGKDNGYHGKTITVRWEEDVRKAADGFRRSYVRRSVIAITISSLAVLISLGWGTEGWHRYDQERENGARHAAEADARTMAAEAKADKARQGRIDDIRDFAKHVEKAIRIGSPLVYAPALAGLAEHVRRNPGDADGAATMFLALIAKIELEAEDAGRPDPDRASSPAGSTQPDARQRDHPGGN